MKKNFILITLVCSFSINMTFAVSEYSKFGGRKKMVSVVNDFVSYLLADSRTKKFFIKVPRIDFKRRLFEQFCVELGGKCVYKGESMKKSHKKLKINERHFYALVELLQRSMDQNNVSQRSQNILLAKLAPMYKDIVTK